MTHTTFTQHVIDNPQIFCQHDTHFICSYHILNKVKFMLDDTYLVDEDGKYYKIKPKHWIVSTMDKYISNRTSIEKYEWLMFDYEHKKLTFIEKPEDEVFTEEKKRYVKYSKKEII